MKRSLLYLGAAMLFMLPALSSATTIADVVVIVDESSSMSGEHSWISGMLGSLNTALLGRGVTANFALIGYGNGLGGGQNSGRTLAGLGSLADVQAATSNLVLSGGTEDGYAGINYALNNLTFTSGAVRNFILITDEDRDNTNSALTYESILNALGSALLNVVVNNPFTCTGGTTANTIGVSANGTGYLANGSGGFTACANGLRGNGAGATETQYVDLAFATGGAGWNLNLLRAGGATADSFTAAFVDIKTQEIVNQGDVPEPSTFLMLGAGLFALGAARFRK